MTEMNNQAQQDTSPRPPLPPRASNQASIRAALCALIPGIGAVYNREYVKAVVHFTVFASLAIIADTQPIFGLAAFSYYVYTIIDAYRSAEVIARRGGPSEVAAENINLPLWGGILVVLGVVFLLDNLGAIRLRSAADYWPLILIFLGGYLILNYLKGDSPKSSASTGAVPPQSSMQQHVSETSQPSSGAAGESETTPGSAPPRVNQRIE